MHHLTRLIANPHRRGGVFLAVAGGLLAMFAPARADDILPKAPPATRYAKMAAHSPFAPPTAPVTAQAAPPPPPAPGWADCLTATMIAQEGARCMVTVVDAQNGGQHLYLTTDPDPTTKIAVVSVKWGTSRDDPPTITLSKGKEFAQVRYEAGTGSAGGPGQGGGGPAIPGAGRNPGPGGLAASQVFRSPAMPNPGPGGSVLRRPLIRAQPPATAPGAPVRPTANAPNPVVRQNPATIQLDEDDDD